MKRLFDSLLPSVERMRPMSHADKIAYLNGWLLRARGAVYVPWILTLGISVAVLITTSVATPLWNIMAGIAVFGFVPFMGTAALVSHSRLRHCTELVTSENWSDRSDVGLLVQMYRHRLSTFYLTGWTLEQLANAVLIHYQSLDSAERANSIKAFRHSLSFYDQHGVYEQSYIKSSSQIVAAFQVLAALGGRSELALIRSLRKRVEKVKGCTAIVDAAESSQKQLEERLAEEATLPCTEQF